MQGSLSHSHSLSLSLSLSLPQTHAHVYNLSIALYISLSLLLLLFLFCTRARMRARTHPHLSRYTREHERTQTLTHTPRARTQARTHVRKRARAHTHSAEWQILALCIGPVTALVLSVIRTAGRRSAFIALVPAAPDNDTAMCSGSMTLPACFCLGRSWLHIELSRSIGAIPQNLLGTIMIAADKAVDTPANM